MRKKVLIIALAAALGISTGAGNMITSFAAESSTEIQENVFGDGSSEVEAENEEIDSENEFSSGEDSEESGMEFQDGESENATTSADDFVYQIDGILEQVTVVKYKGAEADVVIPAEIEGYPVTKISSGIFDENNGIQSLTISENVREIGENAFRNLDSLEKVTISTRQKEIKGLSFEENRSLRAVEISGSLEVLNARAFLNCTSLVKVVFPFNIKTIEYGAFYNTGITSIIVPDSVYEIGENVFSNCDNLEKVVLSKNLNKIPDSAFASDKNLKELNLHDGIERIEDYAFAYSGLEKINLPSTLKSIGRSAFVQCYLKELEVPASVSSIGMSALGNNGNIQMEKLVIRGSLFLSSIDFYNEYDGYNIPKNIYGVKELEVEHLDVPIKRIDLLQNLKLSTPDDSTAHIVWSPLNDEAEYKIYRSENKNGPFNEIATTFNSFYDDKNLDSDKNYYYKICAYYKDDDVLGNMSAIIKRERISIKDCTINKIGNQWYTGNEIKPAVTVKSNSTTLKKGNDYTLEYQDNIKCGTATVTVNGIGSYTGTKTVTFKIVKKPAKPKISSVTVNGTGKLVIKWKKVKNVKGYELYRKDQFDSTYYKVKTITNGNTTQYTNSGLESGTKYTYKIRSYSVIDGTKIYSAFSSAKSRTTKRKNTYVGVHSYKVRVTAPDGGVNMRSGAGVEYYKVLSNMIPNGTILTITREAVASNGNSWGYTNYRGTYGWIALTQVTKYREGEPTEGAPIPHTRYVINCQRSITLRTRPDVNAPEIYQIPLGTAVATFDYAGNGFITVYYRGRTGYCLAYYLSDPIN